MTFTNVKVILESQQGKPCEYAGARRTGKEGIMDEMNDTLRMMIKAIIQIIKDSKDKEEALAKIEALLK